MKLELHKYAVLGLVIPVFLSAIFCCCLTDSLHAQQPEPSCHSTNHQSAAHQNTDDCGCDRTMAILQDGAVMDIAVVKTSIPAILHEIHDLLEPAVFETTAFSPPVVLDTSALYIKHSILRI